MDVFEMVVVVVALSVTAGVINAWIKSRRGGTAGPAGMTAEQSAHLAKLEERIKALEAVVGDGSYELKQKLKDLERTA
ncbi:MAG: hypothetical protein ACRETF_01255 [Nevskiaceae bacterium]